MTGPTLTPRQREIDRLLSAGVNPLEICGKLRISGKTFRSEIAAIEMNRRYRTSGHMVGELKS